MAGLMYVPDPDPQWRVARDGARCRDQRSGHGTCGAPAGVELHNGAGSVWPWYAYCDVHAASRGHWAEDGQVLTWALRHADGSVLGPAEARKAQAVLAARMEGGECKPHHCARSRCHPSLRHTYSLRLRGDLTSDADLAADDSGAASTAAWMTMMMEAALGYLRCPRCDQRDEDAAPVPVRLGDVTGSRTWGERVAEAAQAVEDQHPRHEPVLIGADVTVPAPVVFRPPIPATVPDHSAKKGRRAS